MKKKKTTIKKLLIVILVITVYLIFKYIKLNKSICNDMDIPTFTTGTISEFNGNDASKPIYLAFEGCVYDVSPGREKFYGPNMEYNYLAGTDATSELHIAGGGIIKAKYKIVGKFKK